MPGLTRDLFEVAFRSDRVPELLSGHETDVPMASFIGELIRETEDDALVEAMTRACFPANYGAGNRDPKRSDSLKKLPDLIKRLRASETKKPPQAKRRKRPESAAVQAAKVVAGMALFHNAQDERFLAMPQEGGGIVNAPINSTAVADLIQYRFFRASKQPLSDKALREVRGMLCAVAKHEGPLRQTFVRVAHVDDAVWIDLGQERSGAVVKITADGWEVTTECPVAFVRPAGFGALPTPQQGGDLTRLREILALPDETWHLALSFLINALGPGPFAFGLVDGEHGAGKTFLCVTLKQLIDPVAVPNLRLPKSERDLMIQARENWVLAFDNASGIKWDMSDALSALATGAGFSTRRLFTDDESRTFYQRRPFLINGIGDFASREDLLDRAIPISIGLVTCCEAP